MYRMDFSLIRISENFNLHLSKMMHLKVVKDFKARVKENNTDGRRRNCILEDHTSNGFYSIKSDLLR